MAEATTRLESPAGSRLLAKVEHWADGLSDWINPIVVKEVRQAMTGWHFAMIAVALVGITWFGTIIMIVVSGPSVTDGHLGRDFLYGYAIVLAISTQFFIPLMAYRSLTGERDGNTFELLSITSIRPRQIVAGKLLSAMVQVVLLYLIVAPFVAFTSLMEGFDLPLVMFLTVLGLLISLSYVMLALAMASLPKNFHSLGFLMVLAGGVSHSASLFPGLWAMLFFPIPFEDWRFWTVCAAYLLLGISYGVMAFQFAESQLTFESDNRSTPLRISQSLQMVLVIALAAAMPFFTWSAGGVWAVPTDFVVPVALGGLLQLSAFGFVFSTESDKLSRRVLRSIPKNAFFRLIAVCYFPGGSRGLLYTTLHMAVIGGLALAAIQFFSASRYSTSYRYTDPDTLSLIIVVGAIYAWNYVALAAWMSRTLQSWDASITPRVTRVVVAMVYVMGLIVPHVISILLAPRNWERYINFINPAEVIWHLGRNTQDVSEKVVVVGLLVVGGILLVLNANSLVRGISEVLRGPGLPTATGTERSEGAPAAQPNSDSSVEANHASR